MPHLSPMSWLIAFLSFYLLLGLFMSTLWWQQLPKFPNLSSTMSKKGFKWNWS